MFFHGSVYTLEKYQSGFGFFSHNKTLIDSFLEFYPSFDSPLVFVVLFVYVCALTNSEVSQN